MTTTTQQQPNGITFSTEGQRVYVLGNTYALKDEIKAAGGHWDADRKAWWIGKKKQAELEAKVASATPKCRDEDTGEDIKVRGRAEYKGKAYYFVWSGETQKGKAFKLVFRDGSKTFWADASQVKVLKTYGREDYRTGRIEYPTIKSLREYAERMKDPDREPTRAELYQELEALDDQDNFQAARAFAQEHGLRY